MKVRGLRPSESMFETRIWSETGDFLALSYFVDCVDAYFVLFYPQLCSKIAQENLF